LKVLKQEYNKLMDKTANRGRLFSFSQVMRYVKESSVDNVVKSENEARVKMLNKFVARYQDKFFISDVYTQKKNTDLTYVDFDYFYQNSKEMSARDL
jgi:hypothetical protein